jgi:hypothetical protein
MSSTDEDFISTQIVNEATILSTDTTINTDNVDGGLKQNIQNIWGLLRRKGSTDESNDIKLLHRVDENNRRDTYTLGRNSRCDIVIADRRISSFHCMIYCDYSLPKLRVFIEDTSGKFLHLLIRHRHDFNKP